MNILLSYYQDMNLEPEWIQKHSSSAKNVITYAFKGTNGRSLLSMINAFEMMEEVEGLERNNWEKLSTTNQEKHKQYPVRMLETKLFYKDTDGIFHKTSKGEAYKNFISQNFAKNEQWAINYIFLLDSYFEDMDNYLLSRSQEIFNTLCLSLPTSYIVNAVNQFLKASSEITNFADLTRYDYFFISSFHDDPDFLEKYHQASAAEKEELSNYILNNYATKTYSCCLSRKYMPGGVYNVSELKDDALIFAISLEIIKDQKYIDYNITLNKILNHIHRYLPFNISSAFEYLNTQKDIIEPILLNIYHDEDISTEDEENELLPFQTIRETHDFRDAPEAKVDDTTIAGKQSLDSKFAYRKKLAKKMSDYHCELEQYKGCRYFTSKKTGHNYVEVHHFVPKEFRNNYEYSIDVFANYITLCPHCHKMIHLAADRERIDAIRYIFNKRAARLHQCGINVELKDLLKYYKVTDI